MQPIRFSWMYVNGSTPNDSLSECATKEQRTLYLDLSARLGNSGEADIVSETGCRPRCRRAEFKTEVLVMSETNLTVVPENAVLMQVTQEISATTIISALCKFTRSITLETHTRRKLNITSTVRAVC